MTDDIQTLELAKIYESQGFFKDALNIYSALDIQDSSNETKAGLKRMEKEMENEGQEGHANPEKKISKLFEKWLMLMVLKQRLNNFKKIKVRLT
ncbi:MAG: hypothetical protein GY699_11115 [Desulfobacteraceae bacterium]|nr:hypothetical protein [Desulfobacteraceae bacterium]